MLVKHLFLLVSITCICSCNGNSESQENRVSEKQSGIYIENGSRQGFQYFNTAGTEFDYRYNKITIANDSVVPVNVEIYFSGKKDQHRSKVFLLPRHLTPGEQNFEYGMSNPLKKFLTYGIDKPQQLNKILAPSEKCILVFGVLTETKDFDPTTPFGTRLLISDENSSVRSVKLKINDDLIIPCGKLSYFPSGSD